jgi:hypothetical protein
MFYVPGPVYLENKELEVIYSSRQGLVWQKGVVTQREHFVKVETIEGEDVYRIFDHVTVGIQLKGELLLMCCANPLPWLKKVKLYVVKK